MDKRSEHEPADYEVGKYKPPKATQFKKGHSGNPAGRRGDPDPGGVIERALNRKITIEINGKRRRTPAIQALLRLVAERGLKGDIRAIGEIHRLAAKLNEAQARAAQVEPETLAVFNLNGTDDAVTNALEIVGAMTERSTGPQRLMPWIIEVGLARRGRPLTQAEEVILTRSVEGYSRQMPR